MDNSILVQKLDSVKNLRKNIKGGRWIELSGSFLKVMSKTTALTQFHLYVKSVKNLLLIKRDIFLDCNFLLFNDRSLVFGWSFPHEDDPITLLTT